jgi:hypothetical protein
MVISWPVMVQLCPEMTESKPNRVFKAGQLYHWWQFWTISTARQEQPCDNAMRPGRLHAQYSQMKEVLDGDPNVRQITERVA